MLNPVAALRAFIRSRYKDIHDPATGELYLRRFYLTPKGDWWRKHLPGVFLHNIVRSDYDRELHDHPWAWAVSLILAGGYTEIRREASVMPNGFRFFGPLQCMFRGPGCLNFIRGSTFHRICLLPSRPSVWSLFVVGPRDDSRTWGFISNDHLHTFTPFDQK